MEPAPLLDIELGATPAPQVELLDPGHDSGPAGTRDSGLDPGLDVPLAAASSDEAPYLRLRTSADASSILTPTPMIDLTDLAVAMPTPPPITSLISNPILPLRTLPARDPADQTGVTPLPTPIRRSRVTLSRPRLAGLGVLAFSAGLLTAATAGVLVRPAGVVSAATMARTAATPPVTPPVTAPATTDPGASAPVLAAAEVAAPAPALPAARAELEPAPAAPVANAPLEAAAAPAAKTAAATTGKARGKGATPVRGRARTTNRSRSGTHVDSGVGQGELAAPATEGASDEARDAPAPPAAASKRQKGDSANWVDPFAE